jgi:hypothetical protein
MIATAYYTRITPYYPLPCWIANSEPSSRLLLDIIPVKSNYLPSSLPSVVPVFRQLHTALSFSPLSLSLSVLVPTISFAESLRLPHQHNVILDSNSQTQASQGKRLWLHCCLVVVFIVVVIISLSELGQPCCFSILLGLISSLNVGITVFGLDVVIHGSIRREKAFTARYVVPKRL